jgi:hypothetical protein
MVLSLRPSLSLRLFVIAGLTRNPVVVWHWIPDVETPDLIRGRDDKLDGWDDKWQVWDDKPDVRDDKTEGRGTFAQRPLRRLFYAE